MGVTAPDEGNRGQRQELQSLNKQQIKLYSSRQTDHWATPRWPYDRLDAEFHFDLDPCPLCAHFDGLRIPWIGSIFVNPPYSRAKDFLAQAHEELSAGRAKTIVFLPFANTNAKWFHKYVYHRAELRFIKGRIRFEAQGKTNSAVRPSLLAIFRNSKITTSRSSVRRELSKQANCGAHIVSLSPPRGRSFREKGE
jgi:phage N-6-adenine-methyltransferase